jgi:enamine deaminase RidA (YjgF/YER057c/UK114 family)
MSDVEKVNRAVAAAYGESLAPPLVHVEWTNSSPIEIELVAFAPAGKLEPPAGDGAAETVRYLTPPWLKSSPVFSRAAIVDGGTLIYTRSLRGRRPASGEDQVRDIFAQLKALTESSGSDLAHLVKATYYVSDEDASAKLNTVRPEIYDPRRPPAASKAGVAGVGDLQRGIAIDMIAVTKK